MYFVLCAVRRQPTANSAKLQAALDDLMNDTDDMDITHQTTTNQLSHVNKAKNLSSHRPASKPVESSDDDGESPVIPVQTEKVCDRILI